MDGTVLVCLKGWEDVRSSLGIFDLSRFGLILVHVTEAGPLGAREMALAGLAGRRIPPNGLMRMSRAAEETSRELLAEAEKMVLAAEGRVLSLEHRVGEPGREIVRLAGEAGAGLIVLWAGEAGHRPPAGPPGHPSPPPQHGDKHPLPPPPKAPRHLSPVVHFVLTHAACPVLVLP